jgi:hypothetical protein
VEANNHSSGWDVEIDRCDYYNPIKKKNPSFFQFSLEQDNGICPEIAEGVEEPKGKQRSLDDFLERAHY